MLKKIKETVRFIQDRIAAIPKVGIILGSGLGDLASEIENTTNIAYSDIPESYHGELLQFASELLLNTGTSVASVIYSLDIFYKLSEGEPDLLNELTLIIHQILPYASAGVKSKSIKTLRKIEKLGQNFL